MADWKDRVRTAAVKTQDLAKQAKEQYDSRQAEKADNAYSSPNSETPLLQVGSHDEGKNAVVSLYPDRIERVKARSALSVSKAHQDTEVIPLSRVSHIRAEKKGFRTNVRITVGGEDIVFRVGHEEAARFKDAVTKLMLGTESGSSSVTTETDPADQIRKLAGLRDEGILTEEEFAAKKKEILGL